MLNNFFLGLTAIIHDIRLFFDENLHNSAVLGFTAGLFTTVLVVGFIITKNPHHIPIILRYSSFESFQKIAARDSSGTFKDSFSNFVKIYTQVRMLFLMTFISFCVMITTIVLVSK